MANGKYILICASVVVLVKPVVYTFGTLYKYTVLMVNPNVRTCVGGVD